MSVQFVLLFPAYASENDDELGDGLGGQFGFVPKRSWQESEVKLPPAPLTDDLIVLKIFQFPQYKFYIDSQSIDVSGGDNVVRFTVILEPPSGLRNVFFEGIRCDKRRYKTYATSLWGQSWQSHSDSEWYEIATQGVGVYRDDLFRYFLCENSIIKADKKEIVQLLQSPPDNFIDEELE